MLIKISAIAITLLCVASAEASQSKCNAIRDADAKIACLDKAAAEQRTKPRSGVPDPVDLLKDENEQIQRRLKGICKGC